MGPETLLLGSLDLRGSPGTFTLSLLGVPTVRRSLADAHVAETVEIIGRRGISSLLENSQRLESPKVRSGVHPGLPPGVREAYSPEAQDSASVAKQRQRGVHRSSRWRVRTAIRVILGYIEIMENRMQIAN